jgi:hypothetical protein
MGQNLTGQLISTTYEDLVQISGSVLTDGLGNDITSITVTASEAISASFATSASSAVQASTAGFATSASYAAQAGTAGFATTASYALNVPTIATGSFMVTGSIAGNTITFEKADSSTFDIVLPTGSTATPTGSLLVTSSISDATMTFTKGDGSTYNLVVNNVQNASTASIAGTAGFATSASYALVAGTSGYAAQAGTSGFATSASYASTSGVAGYANTAGVAGTSAFANTATSASYAQTASFALNVTPINTGSFVTTASISDATVTFTKADASTFDITVNNVQNASTASVIDTTPADDNVEYAVTFVAQEAAGTQAVRTDDNSNITFNPTTAVLSVPTLNGNALTATSASHALIANNLTPGANITVNDISASNGNFVTLSAVSASFGYVQTVTGSAVIIGDEFIILNADTPTARYAGMIVYDSGSNATASLEWDGEIDTWIAVEETQNTAVMITGPTGSRGSETYTGVNKLQKGLGWNYIGDSSITDDGTTVSIAANVDTTGSVAASAGFVGNLTGNADTATSASHALASDTATSASYALTASFALNGGGGDPFPYSGSAVISGSLNVSSSIGASNVILNQTDTFSPPKVNEIVTLTQAEYDALGSYDNNTFYIISDSDTLWSAYTGSDNVFGRPEEFGYLIQQQYPTDVVISSSIFFSVGAEIGGAIRSAIIGGSGHRMQDNTGGFAGANPENSIIMGGTNNKIYGDADGIYIIGGNNNIAEAAGNNRSGIIGGQNNNAYAIEDAVIIGGFNNLLRSESDRSISIGGANNTYDFQADNVYIAANGCYQGTSRSFVVLISSRNFSDNMQDYNVYLGVNGGGGRTFTPGTSENVITYVDTLNVSGSVSASFFSGDGSGLTNLPASVSASYATSASYADVAGTATSATSASHALAADSAITASYVNLSSVTQDIELTGSLRGQVNALNISSLTASMDCSVGNFFTLTLVDGNDTHVVPSNILPGQTINMRVTNGVTGTGTISFANSVLQPSGSIYTATTGSDVYDIVTFISFDNANLSLSAVKNFI